MQHFSHFGHLAHGHWIAVAVAIGASLFVVAAGAVIAMRRQKNSDD